MGTIEALSTPGAQSEGTAIQIAGVELNRQVRQVVAETGPAGLT